MTAFDYNTAKKHLGLGKRVRTTEWPDDTFIYFSNDGTYRDENNEIFSFTDDYEEDDFVLQGVDECQTQEIFEKTDESGAKVDGEHQSKLNAEEKQTESGGEHRNMSKNETKKDGPDTTTMKNSEIEEKKKMNDTTETIKKSALKGEPTTGE